MTSSRLNDASDVIGSDGRGDSFKLPAVGLLLLAVVYWVTRAPFVLPGDSAELITASVTLGLAHPTGYPLYIVVGKLMSSLFFFAPAATVLNVFSAACCLASLALLALTLRKLHVSPLISAAVLVLLGMTPSIWNYSTFAEVYTLHAFLLAVIMWLLVTFPDQPTGFRLCAVWALAGASLGNHMTSILLIPGLAVWTFLVLRSAGPRRPRFPILWIVSSYAAGASIIGLLIFLDRPNAINYINQYAVEISDPRFSNPVSRVLWIVFAQQYGAVSGIADSVLSFGWLSGVAHVLRTAWSESPVLLVVGGIGLISGLAGWKARSCPRPFFAFLGITAAMNILYFATYTRFFEPIFLIHLYLALAVGMAYFLGRTIHFGKGRSLVALLIFAVALSQLIATSVLSTSTAPRSTAWRPSSFW